MNTINIKDGNIAISVSVFIFKDNDVYLAYCPSLDLVGYNTDVEGAKADFEWVLNDYMKDQCNNGTLHEDLTTHCWKMKDDKGQEPDMGRLLRSNSRLKSFVESYAKRLC